MNQDHGSLRHWLNLDHGSFIINKIVDVLLSYLQHVYIKLYNVYINIYICLYKSYLYPTLEKIMSKNTIRLLLPNQSVHGKYNLISVWFNKISLHVTMPCYVGLHIYTDHNNDECMAWHSYAQCDKRSVWKLCRLHKKNMRNFFYSLF